MEDYGKSDRIIWDNRYLTRRSWTQTVQVPGPRFRLAGSNDEDCGPQTYVAKTQDYKINERL